MPPDFSANRMELEEYFRPKSSDLFWVSVKKVFTPYVYKPLTDTILTINDAKPD